MGEHTMYPESFWKTMKETVTKVVGKETITREISIGMTVKSDNRAPSPFMYEKLTAALNFYIEQEHNNWLNQDKMVEFLNKGKSKKETTPKNKPEGKSNVRLPSRKKEVPTTS